MTKKTKSSNKTRTLGSTKSFYQMRNVADDAVVYIYDEIGGWGMWAMDLVDELSRINAATIRVRIHSDGGWVDEAIAIHNVLRKHPARIITETDSIAASAASFVFQAGDERVIAENGRLMIHDVQGGVRGSEAVIRAYADHMPLVREAIIATYAYRTRISADEVRAMMTGGTDVYLQADEAVAKGFADRVEKLSDMGEPPRKLQTQDHKPSNRSSNVKKSLRELNTIYALSNNGRSHNQGEKGMTKKEHIAALKEMGTDVEALQRTVANYDGAMAGKSSADIRTMLAVVGDCSAEELTRKLAATTRYHDTLVSKVLAGRRLLNLCGDSDDAVTEAKQMLSTLDISMLEVEAHNMEHATSSMRHGQLTPHDGDAPTNDHAVEGNAAVVETMLASAQAAGLSVARTEKSKES